MRCRRASAAVDKQNLSGDEGRRVGSEKGDRLGNVLWLAEATRRLRGPQGFKVGVLACLEHVGKDDARCDGIDPDLALGQFQRHGAREACHRGLRRDIVGVVPRPEHGPRRDIDDRGAFSHPFGGQS